MDTSSSQNRLSVRLRKLKRYQKHVKASLPFLLAFGCALLAGLIFFNGALIAPLASVIINMGLDPQRSQLIAALVMTSLVALTGAFIGRRRFVALVGAGLLFVLNYLLDFIHVQTQPTYDPGRHLEPLDVGALVHTSFVMVALALLCAFVGAAVGKALGEVLLDPLYHLFLLIQQRLRASSNGTSLANLPTQQLTRPVSLPGTIVSLIGTALLLVLLILASGSGDLFVFSPDVGLHTPPQLSNGPVTHGTIVQDSMISPALGGQKRNFLIYLPPSYNTPQGQQKRYPTLYLLHGSPGSDKDWFTAGKANESADTLIALKQIPELIIVSPDGNGRPGATSEWGNSGDHRQNIETFVAVDLVHYVDAKYRTIPKQQYRAIGGLSMGGFGAMNIALHHPDTFGSVISLGGYFYAEGSIWGHNPAYLRANSPADILPTDKAAWSLHYFLGAGSKDQPYYNDAKAFARELASFHIPYHFDLQSGYHSWKVWQTQMYNALLWLGPLWQQQGAS